MPTKPPIPPVKKEAKFRYPVWTISFLISLILILIISNGVLVYDKFSTSFSITQSPDKQEILKIIEKDSIYDLPEEKQRELWEIKGVVASLDDPYSEFLLKEELEEFRNGIEEQYEGIGIQFNFEEEIQAEIVFENSPAAKAGVKNGDILKKIGGIDVELIPQAEIINKIRGPKGSTVDLVFERNGEELEFSIVRDKIDLDSASLRFENNLAIIKISSFSEDLEAKFTEIVLEINQTPNVKGIILDLRGNTGGILGQSIEVASFFLEKDTLFVTEEGKNFREEIRTFEKNPNLKDYKTVVLVDKSSASASEILAASLQENKDIKLIGQTTFGKGLVQKIYDLPDGHALKLTIARWKTPKGKDINKEGIIPDVELIEEENTAKYAIDNFDSL